MGNEEGTPKRRRGLFRRDRTNDTAAAEPRLAADGFDDPWSASAWDDWDDDFTAGNLRSSVPAAAAPRPEAVDAWLQSEADDFDTATRLNAKRWGGEANREPASGLASLRRSTDAPPVPDVIAADDAPIDHAPIEEVSVPEEPGTEAPIEEPPAKEAAIVVVEEPFASSADDQVDEPDRSDETNEVSPTWEPVADAPSTGVPSTEVSDYDSDGDLDDVLDALADADTPSTFEALTVQDDPTSVSLTEPDRDELLEIDEIEPSDEFTPELAMLDASPTKPPVPAASWAPIETIEVRLPVASESSTVDDRRLPAAPSAPAAPTPPPPRFVSVSVVDDEPALPEPIAAIVDLPPPTPTPAFTAPEPQARTADVENDAVETGAFEIASPAPSVPAVASVPAGRSRRWADLAAEFGSDGDLEDSYPRRSRPAPSPIVGATPDRAPARVADDPTLASPRVEVASINELASKPATGPAIETVFEVEPVIEHEPAAVQEVHPAELEPPPAPHDEITADLVEDAGSDEVDPWSLPPVRGPRQPAGVEPPVRSRLPGTSAPAKPAPTRPIERPSSRPEPRPSTNRADEAPTSRPVRPAAERAPRPATAPRTSTSTLSPEFPTFAGVVGSALVAFAVARLVLALVGDQPKIPATFTGTSARLVRLGATFANIGTSWPLALLVGTVLLLLPVFAGFTDHLRRWAPIVGLASVTAVFAVTIGALQFYAGDKLGSPSTLRLLSDVIVGPIGFGVLTLVTVAFGTRAHRR